MALIAAASFDYSSVSYTPSELGVSYNPTGSAWLTSSGGRTGSQIRDAVTPANTKYIQLEFAAASEFFFQVCAKMSALPSSDNYYFVQWLKGSTILGCAIIRNASGLLEVYRGDKVTLLATGTNPLRYDGTYAFYEFHIKLDEAAGVIQTRKDGVLDIDYAGDTMPGSDTTADKIRVFSIPGTGVYYDDFVVHDVNGPYNKSWPNGAHVSVLRPNGAGGLTQWDPSSGSNYACLDEAAPSMTDYVYTNTADEIDTYALGNLPAEAATVKAVIPHYWGHKEGAPAVTQIKRVLRKSSTNYEGGALAVPATTMGLIAAAAEILETDPAAAPPSRWPILTAISSSA
jgi:hypothetical protein